ncbi:hypothetical protein NGUA15_04626 [Salmonella enterica]|nr:hypothetical protein NGUA15_04626 [Salmonella enterica]CHW81580.1 Uncharacterised protein [Salmonella enterica subsp. enterica serovar Typhi]
MPSPHMLENTAVDVGTDNLLHVFTGIEFNIVFRRSGFEFFFPLLQRF